MKDASKKVLDTLSSRGYRITDARKSIVEILATQEQPITTQLLASLVSSDEASVYRTVRVLMSENFLEEVSISGETARYALMDGHGHHHHLVCTKCNFVSHIECNMHDIPKSVSKEFKNISDHTVTYYGICKACD